MIFTSLMLVSLSIGIGLKYATSAFGAVSRQKMKQNSRNLVAVGGTFGDTYSNFIL